MSVVLCTVPHYLQLVDITAVVTENDALSEDISSVDPKSTLLAF